MTKSLCRRRPRAAFAGVLPAVLARLALVAAVCSLAAFPPPARAGAAPADSGSRQVLAVQLAGNHPFEFVPFVVALERGFYRAAGLDVVLREWVPGIDVASEVGDGRAAFGTLDSTLIVARAKGHPLVALAALWQHSPVALLVRRQAGRDAVSELAGKRVATTRTTENEILAYLAASGVTSERFQHLTAVADVYRALATGEADAGAVFIGDPAVEPLMETGGYQLLLPRSAGIDLYGMLLLTSQALLQSQPETVRAFRAATLMGLRYTFDHPEEAVDLILSRYHTLNRSRGQLLFEASRMRDLALVPGVAPGAMDVARWRHVLEVYTGLGRLEHGTDLLGFVYDPDAGSLGPFLPWMLGGGVLGLLLVTWGVRRFLARET